MIESPVIVESMAFWSATTAYAVSSLAFFLWLAFRRSSASTIGLVVAAVGLVPHTAAIVLRWLDIGHGPFSSRYEVLSANAWLTVAVVVALGLTVRRLAGLGVVAMPAAFLLMGWAVSAFEVRQEVPIIFKSVWLWLHIGFAKLFFVFALLAAASAITWLVKNRAPNRFEMLPDPRRLDLYGHQFLLVSFLCLGVMIVAGSLWAHESWGRYWGWDPIETAALATWIAYGIILHFRVLHRWDGRRMAWLNLVAFALAVITLYVVVLILPTVHDFYMVGGG